MLKLISVAFIISVFSIIAPDATIGQSRKIGIPEVEYFNRRQYGGSTQNWKIAQGKNNLLYFANTQGLLSYDDVSWRLHKEEGSYGLRCVHAIGERIYTGSFNEFGYFEPDARGQLIYHSLANTPELKNQGDYWNIYDWNGSVVFRSDKSVCFFEMINWFPLFMPPHELNPPIMSMGCSWSTMKRKV